MKHIASFRPRFFEVFRGYSRQTFSADLMAGLVVGIVALPLAIAFGIASGVSPEKGIITAVVAGFVVSLLGGSRVQIGGPTGAFIVIVYGVVQQYGETGLLVATFMAGVLLVAMGLFKLGAVIRFIPYPVVVGFTAGIALTIFTTQIADLFGMNFGGEPVPGDFIGKWMLYFRHFGSVNWANLAVGMGSILLIVLTPRFSRRIPGSLVAIVVLTAGVWALRTYAGMEGVDTIGDRFTIRADRFLRNMVRALVGTLVDVGRGRYDVEEFRAIVESRDLSRASGGAPAEGLYLWDVAYPAGVFRRGERTRNLLFN